jgi:hypothetical protein
LNKASLDLFMTRADRNTFFTALAFFAVAGKSGRVDNADAADNIRKLASLAQDFCADEVMGPALSVPEEPGVEAIDAAIDRHIVELRDKETTRLPENRDALAKLCDRLEHRKIRSARYKFYGSATEDQLADRVLQLLDAEIARAGRLGLI